ncbi:hypothetical protein HQ590_02025 [bacterium]|nr:hypothetical protein [bacterium]
MTTRERMTTALNGGEPDVTPYSIYGFFLGDTPDDAWRRLFDHGLGLTVHCATVAPVEHGVETSTETRTDGDSTYTIQRKQCPAGTLQRVLRNGWHYEDWIKTPADYRTRQWMIEHTELVPRYENYEAAAARAGDHGVVVVSPSRSPAMSINIDWAGTQQFCLDLAVELPELFALYEAQRQLFLQEAKLVAAGPGPFVDHFENLTISMLGPAWYRRLLVSVYEETFPILRRAGKRVFVHYDGALRVIADQIAAAPLDGIESLTEPPEGNLRYDECRRFWPELVFWGNINLDLYARPATELAQAVIGKRQRAGKRGLLFEISEDLPANWATTIPVVLETLTELG